MLLSRYAASPQAWKLLSWGHELLKRWAETEHICPPSAFLSQVFCRSKAKLTSTQSDAKEHRRWGLAEQRREDRPQRPRRETGMPLTLKFSTQDMRFMEQATVEHEVVGNWGSLFPVVWILSVSWGVRGSVCWVIWWGRIRDGESMWEGPGTIGMICW